MSIKISPKTTHIVAQKTDNRVNLVSGGKNKPVEFLSDALKNNIAQLSKSTK